MGLHHSVQHYKLSMSIEKVKKHWSFFFLKHVPVRHMYNKTCLRCFSLLSRMPLKSVLLVTQAPRTEFTNRPYKFITRIKPQVGWHLPFAVTLGLAVSRWYIKSQPTGSKGSERCNRGGLWSDT